MGCPEGVLKHTDIFLGLSEAVCTHKAVCMSAMHLLSRHEKAFSSHLWLSVRFYTNRNCKQPER